MPDEPSMAARTRRGANAANRAFVVEALVLLVFLAVSVALVLQLFSAAGVMSRKAHVLSVSEHLATNAAESFSASPTVGSTTSYFDENGQALNSGEGAAYTVVTKVNTRSTGYGMMYTAEITVTSEDDAANNAPYVLETQRYLSTDKQFALGRSGL